MNGEHSDPQAPRTAHPKSRPILFSGAMVRAILDGRKTQTRRVIKPVQPRDDGMWPAGRDPVPDCPYGQVGDLLWVRETWRTESDCYNDLAPGELSGEETILYAADADWGSNRTVGRSRPSIHMPRWASRLTLRVMDVRVERLQAISAADAIAEGCAPVPLHSLDCDSISPVQEYRALWGHINGRGSWAANPWVWVVSFERLQEQRVAA